MRLAIFIFFSLISFKGFAQFPDSVAYNAEIQMAVSNQPYLSQWIVANRYGKLNDNQADGYLFAGFYAPYTDDTTSFKFSFGFDYLLKPEIKESRIQQGFVKVKFHALELSVGKYERTVGAHNADLSTGSLALSRNAPPMPVAAIGFPEYTNIPFTQGYVKFKGYLLHGWFEKDRYVDRPYLHEKSFYLKVGATHWPVNVSAGLVHFAQWGGTAPNGQRLADGFDDFMRIFLGQSAATEAGGGEFVNALGNHLGIIDLGINFTIKDYQIQIYQQDPFEDKLGLTRAHIIYDQLLGLNIKNAKFVHINEFLYEYVNTKHQGGPGIPDPRPGDDPNDLSLNYGYRYGGRDDYYNNYLYQSGWTYQQRILGNSLLFSRQRAIQFLNNIPDFQYSEASANNRIVAHHIGLKGNITQRLKYKLISSYTNNFGTYAGLNNGRFNWASQEPGYENYVYAFKSSQYQCYTLLEGEFILKTALPLSALGSLGYDFGDLYHNFSFMLGMRLSGFFFEKNLY